MRIVLITIGLLVVFICSFISWRRWVEFIPPVETPHVTLPSPNAYDFYDKAGQAHVLAPQGIDPIEDVKTIPRQQWKTSYPVAIKEAWLRKNSKSFQLLRTGFQHHYHAPPRTSDSDTTSLSNTKLRQMARALIVQSHVYREKGQWGKAAGSALDAINLGHDLSSGGILIDYLVGASICALGRRELNEILPQLDSKQAQAAAQRLQRIIDESVPLSTLLEAEKNYTLLTFSKALRWTEWRTMKLSDASGFARLHELWQIYSTPRRTIFNNHKNYLDAVIAITEKPYSNSQKWPSTPMDYYHQSWNQEEAYPSAYLHYNKGQATDVLLLTSLALRAFALDHHRNPLTLNELVPHYLKVVPNDPFGAGKPLRYQPKTTRFTLYSIGPDGIDNKGRVIEQKRSNGTTNFYVFPESKGDFVAGINF